MMIIKMVGLSLISYFSLKNLLSGQERAGQLEFLEEAFYLGNPVVMKASLI